MAGMHGGRNALGPHGFLTDEEQQNMPKVTKELLKRIFSYLLPYWFQLILVVIIILVSSVLGLLPSIITGKNTCSLAFHKKMGFKEVGTFKNIAFKNNEWIDVIYLDKDI